MFAKYFHLLLLSLLLACAGMVQGQAAFPDWQGYKTPIRVACVGDSITAGYGASNQGKSYPSVLGTLLGERFQVRNFGVSGATLLKKGDLSYWTTGALAQASDFAPDAVIILLGTNDAKAQNWAHKDEFAADYRELISHFTELPSKPRVWACLPLPAYTEAFGIRGEVIKSEIIPLIQQVATAAKIPVFDLYTAMSQPNLFQDGIHPTDVGYGLLAGHIFSLFTGAPIITPVSDLFMDSRAVTITSTAPNAEIRYTLDGSAPTAQSLRYSAPITIKATTTVKAVCMTPDGKTTLESTALLTRATMRKPENPTKTQAGLTYQYYEADAAVLAALDKLAALTPVKTGTSTDFTLGEHARNENFGMRYCGYVTVPRDGIYTFATTSDDGSALYIGETLVVDNGGTHGMLENSGKIALAAGAHALTINYFQAGGGFGLVVSYTGPGIEKQAIPASAFSHAVE